MKVGKGGGMGAERGFAGADGCTTHWADVLLSCVFETCVVL